MTDSTSGSPSPSALTIMISGGVLLLGSFLDWVSFSSFGYNAWGDQFPLLTWPAILGAAAAVLVALVTFRGQELPPPPLGFSWPQVYVAFGFTSVLITLGFLIAGDNLAIGFYLSLLASIGLLVGAVMTLNETSGSSPSAS